MRSEGLEPSILTLREYSFTIQLRAHMFVVRLEGLQPSTDGVEIRGSMQLSYRRVAYRLPCPFKYLRCSALLVRNSLTFCSASYLCRSFSKLDPLCLLVLRNEIVAFLVYSSMSLAMLRVSIRSIKLYVQSKMPSVANPATIT